ncbi:hypothetical protein KS4_15920 [Poriferisphaera corsica]|uniref:Penicillin-binding protein activator LpoB n=1 Tax=Poriferisphaera corsica TaxID=2528020 RepID=A0A517YTN7_9BACT|nr:penicillin-binding protein activator LpoB [Poriferisphaera corsica]QDU33542.1 hypothetical protein KS4_15920 [Poriferisphaera corsica]
MNKLALALSLTIGAAALTGCSGPSAQRIDPTGTQTITTVSGLDIQDAMDAAAEMSQSLLQAGVLGQNGKPSKIAISSYVNNTSQHIDRDRIIKKVRVTLNKAGVAQTFTTMNSKGGTTGTEDAIATRQQQVNAFLSDNPAPPKPDYTMTLKLLENKVRAGRTRQTTYIFQMSLTEVNSGLAVWEDEKMITKQGGKAAVGW